MKKPTCPHCKGIVAPMTEHIHDARHCMKNVMQDSVPAVDFSDPEKWKTCDNCPSELACDAAGVCAMNLPETPPAEPAPLNNLFACPTCNGWHFNISRGGTLVCTSRGNVGTVGCGWRGSLEQPPRQEGEKPHPDSLRLDWLQSNMPFGAAIGWDDNDFYFACSPDGKVHCGDSLQLRSALDAAMSAPSAKGATS